MKLNSCGAFVSFPFFEGAFNFLHYTAMEITFTEVNYMNDEVVKGFYALLKCVWHVGKTYLIIEKQ